MINLPECLRAEITVPITYHDADNNHITTSIVIPATSPTNLPWGSYIEVKRVSEHWRQGIWLTEITEVLLPAA